MNNTLYIFSFYKYSLIFFITFFLLLFVIGIKKHLRVFEKYYDTPQKIHNDFVPPFGGLIIFISFFICIKVFGSKIEFLSMEIFLPVFFILLIGLIEDMFNNTKPIIRLIVIFGSSFYFVFVNQNNLPELDIKFINILFVKIPLLEILFYSIGLTALSNGFNMIDGMNGLASLTAISVLIGLGSILQLTNIFYIYQREIVTFSVIIFAFLVLNFPFGKIFLGDAGAYGLGWILGIIIIKIFSLNILNTWGAVIILFYPLMEVSFSTIRKLFQKKNPLYPDLDHLHLKIYYTLKGPVFRSKEFNSFTTLSLMPLWFMPSILIVWTFFYSHLTFIALILMIFIYIYFYLAIPKKSK